MLLKIMKKGATKELMNLLGPVLIWALQASCKNKRGGCRMELTMTNMIKVQTRGQTSDAEAGELDSGRLEGASSGANAISGTSVKAVINPND